MISARTRTRLEEVRDELEVAHGVEVKVAPHDLATDADTQALIAQLHALARPIDLLVANASWATSSARAGWTEPWSSCPPTPRPRPRCSASTWRLR